MIASQFWNNKTVFITGHTGFKGGWLSFWLSELGAKVHGFALDPPTQPNFFTVARLQERLSSSTIGDIRNLNHLESTLTKVKPDIIFHMAAQPLVRESYKFPVETFAANFMGTVNLLEAARRTGTCKAVLNITTDKCYENKEWIWSYRENDRLGGYDPYSASKSCAEIATAAYRNSFLAEEGIYLASVRAGNVIGGGDWAKDRLIPDFFRNLNSGIILTVRYPNSVRPWQHVLEPLAGYLILAEKLYLEGVKFAEAWNFGPKDEDAKSVGWIVERLSELMPNVRWQTEKSMQPHEAAILKLDSSKAKKKLGWIPRWNLETALSKTVDWHLAWMENEDMTGITSEQINTYSKI